MTLLVVVICVLVLTLAYPLRLYVQQQGQIDELAAKNAEQRKRVEALKTKVAGYDDPEWARDEARVRLHFTQPGEKIYLVPAAPATSPAPGRGVASTEAPWFSRLWSGAVGTGQATGGTGTSAGRTGDGQATAAPAPSVSAR
nr:septum formation initiator family protein [Frankia sp. Cppng1_Ct_nod]